MDKFENERNIFFEQWKKNYEMGCSRTMNELNEEKKPAYI